MNCKPMVALTVAALSFAPGSHASSDVFLPPFGGAGGQQFVLRCPGNTVLTGVAALVESYVNHIAPVCDNKIMKGAGGRGVKSNAICPNGSVVQRMDMKVLRSPNRLLKEVFLQCVDREKGNETAILALHTPGAFTRGCDAFKGCAWQYPDATQSCSHKRTVGLQGRAEAAIDALGLICN